MSVQSTDQSLHVATDQFPWEMANLSEFASRLLHSVSLHFGLRGRP